MQHDFVSTSAGELHYVRSGPAGHPPLLLLHSNGGSWRQFEGTLEGFSGAFTSYAVDLPGQGDSFPLNDHFPIERYTDVLVEFLDLLDLDQVTVLGCSIGGSIAIDLAARHPDRVKRLVIVETPVRSDEAWASRWAPMEALFGVVAQPFELAARRVIGLTPQGYAQWNIDRHKAGAKTMVSVMWAMRRHNTFAALERLPRRTLVVFGESTPIADARAVYEAKLPQGPMVTLPGCSHFPMVENAGALVECVMAWLGQETAAKS
ncbi:MAG TPA: alpha/beta hydrolase [Ramlibacter sp.]|nr:alpha/beta hydrolase [Ramlibacter sp.]